MNNNNINMDIIMMNYILESIKYRKGSFVYSDPYQMVHISNNYYNDKVCSDDNNSICESNNCSNYEDVQLFDSHEMKRNNYNEIVLAILFFFTFSALVFFKI